MNTIILRIAPRDGRKTYAVQRMNLAAQRMLRAQTAAEEIRAGHWVLAWAVAAGARPSSRVVGAEVRSFGAINLH